MECNLSSQFFGRQVEQYALIKFIFLQLDKFYVYSFIDQIEIIEQSTEILFQWPGGLLSYWHDVHVLSLM